MTKQLQNIIPAFIKSIDARRKQDYIRLHGDSTGYKEFRAYRLGVETKISHNTLYSYMNNPSNLPSERNLKILCEYYLVQPNEILALVDVDDTE